MFIFVSIFIILEDESKKKILLQFMSKSVQSMLLSKSFTLSGLTFKSLILFELIFVHGVTDCSNFIL